jgi:hypothetical protein
MSVDTELTPNLLEFKLFLSNSLVQINFHQKTVIFKVHKQPPDNRKFEESHLKQSKRACRLELDIALGMAAKRRQI